MGSSGLEPPTSRLSGARSNHLSYEPIQFLRCISFLLSPVCFASRLNALISRHTCFGCGNLPLVEAWPCISSNDASPCGDMMHLLRKNDVATLRSAMMRCLPQNVAKPRIIRRSRHHWRKPTSFAEGKHHSKNAPLSVDKSAFFVGGESGIRTHGPLRDH